MLAALTRGPRLQDSLVPREAKDARCHDETPFPPLTLAKITASLCWELLRTELAHLSGSQWSLWPQQHNQVFSTSSFGFSLSFGLVVAPALALDYVRHPWRLSAPDPRGSQWSFPSTQKQRWGWENARDVQGLNGN